VLKYGGIINNLDNNNDLFKITLVCVNDVVKNDFSNFPLSTVSPKDLVEELFSSIIPWLTCQVTPIRSYSQILLASLFSLNKFSSSQSFSVFPTLTSSTSISIFSLISPFLYFFQNNPDLMLIQNKYGGFY
jgi:hypothetical protein